MSPKKKASTRSTPSKPATGQSTLQKQIIHFLRQASQHVRRVAGAGKLVFFSTETGDAWLLDPDGGLACPLAREGSPVATGLSEAGSRVTIEWSCAYQIREETFIFADHTGRTTAVLGYPTKEILRAIRGRRRLAAG